MGSGALKLFCDDKSISRRTYDELNKSLGLNDVSREMWSNVLYLSLSQAVHCQVSHSRNHR